VISTRGNFIKPSKVNCESAAFEEELVVAAMAGSHVAFGELQRTYTRRLFRRILSITRNWEDAEDALQDTFFRAFQALPLFERRCKFSSWITTIATNSALMIVRKRRTKRETSFEQQMASEQEGPTFDIRDGAPDPEQVCDQNQRSEAILFSIQRLDPKLRVPMGIWVSRECSLKDLAEHLGISLASVKARLHRARKRLLRSPSFRSHRMEIGRSPVSKT
jgi:RNA polymerase sigma-70 factor, ECF subfamily